MGIWSLGNFARGLSVAGSSSYLDALILLWRLQMQNVASAAHNRFSYPLLGSTIPPIQHNVDFYYLLTVTVLEPVLDYKNLRILRTFLGL